MNDWMSQAKAKEEKERTEQAEQERIRMDGVRRIRTVFPAWNGLFHKALIDVCAKLKETFPQDLTRHFSITQKANGFLLRAQGFPERSMDIEFLLDAKTMVLKSFHSQSIHQPDRNGMQRNGMIEITADSQLVIRYTAIINGDQKSAHYSNPEQLANDLVRELTGL